jgi:hypothetical protein
MFKTFKASIKAVVPPNVKADSFISSATEYGFYNLVGEKFEFSKEDVVFTHHQKEKYKDTLRLNPVMGGLFADGVKYNLIKKHIKGNTKYQIEVDGSKADLIIDWWNRQKIEWVHGKNINWKAAAFFATLFAIIVNIALKAIECA